MVEKVDSFASIAGCDREFAASFLEANGWDLESAVNNFMEPGAAASATTANHTSGLGNNPAMGSETYSDAPRAPIAQFRDKLINHDPAHRIPKPATSAQNHPLEAFRDVRRDDPGGDSELSLSAGIAEGKEVFGLPKRPRNLAEIYAAPTDLCFTGTFDELRAAGREQRKWLLINIQSPTEFASQQLNADTWRDETLRAVISASFLFWQQYYDSPDGANYCRFYLPNAAGPTPLGLPHIAVVDPITASSAKTWTGFKDAERLMDKLMEYADDPPTDLLQELCSTESHLPPELSPNHAEAAARGMPTQPSLVGAGDEGEEAQLVAAIAASLEGHPHNPGALSQPRASLEGGPGYAALTTPGYAADATPTVSAAPTSEIATAAPPDIAAQPPGPSAAEVDEMWGPAPSESSDGVSLKIRCGDGSTLMRKFSPSHTLRDVLAAVHATTHRLDPSKQYKLFEGLPGGVVLTDPETSLEAAKVTRGLYNLAEA